MTVCQILQSCVSSPVASPRLAPHQIWIYCSTGSHPPCPHPTMCPQSTPSLILRSDHQASQANVTEPSPGPVHTHWLEPRHTDPTAHSLLLHTVPKIPETLPEQLSEIFSIPLHQYLFLPPLDKRSRLYIRKCFRSVHLYLRDHCWELGVLCT